MESSKGGDRKRKSSITDGLFTRSKSKIYLHCNRSGRIRPDSARSKPYNHQLQQLDPHVKKKQKAIFVENVLEGSSVKDLRAHRVLPPVVLENVDCSKTKSESLLIEEKNESNGNVSIPKINSAVSSSSRRKVFISPSSFSYRRLLPYLKDVVREHSDVSEIEIHDTLSKSNDPTLSKPDLQSMVRNGSASEDEDEDEDVCADFDVSKPLGSVEGQKIELNVSCCPQDLNDVHDVVTQTRVESRVFTNGVGLDPEALEECVQTTPPDADIFCKADVRGLRGSIEHNDQQTEKVFAGHPSDSPNGFIIKKSILSPGGNGSVLRNKMLFENDQCEMSLTSAKDLRAQRVFSPVLENDDNLKKNESPLFKAINENEGVGKIGTESNGNVSIPKINSAVRSNSRRKVFIPPSSFSYRRLLPYLKDAVREHSEIEMHDTMSKSNDPTLSYLKPDPLSMASNGSASEDEHVHAHSDVSKPLGSVEGQKIEPNASCSPQDLSDVPDVVTQTRVEPEVLTNGGGLDPETLEECVQTTPPDADIFCKTDTRDLRASIEHNDQQTEKIFGGHPSERITGYGIKKSSLSPERNGSVLRNKLVLNPCSRLKVFKPASSLSYRRLLPFLMDVAKNDSGGASTENGHPKCQRDLDCNRPSMSTTKEVPTNEEYSPKKDETKEQETKLLEPKCTSANDVTDYLHTFLSTQVLSSAAESFSKKPSSVFPDDATNSQTLLSVGIKGNSVTECTDTNNTEKSEAECLSNEISNFITVANSGVPSGPNITLETSAAEFKVDTANLVPINLEDLLSEYMVQPQEAEPISPEGDHMTLEVDCHDENRNLIQVIGSHCSESSGTIGIHADASEALRKELFLKISKPEPTNNESTGKVFLADSNGDSGGLEAVASMKAASSTEPSDISGYGNDGPTKTLCRESIQEISHYETIGCQKDCIRVGDNVNKNGCLEPAICHQKSTQSESSYDLDTRPDVFSKGILKRNPRGCRGLCNCLNCASFRLHAERAFEFSRNQMLDTEEVALGLMKELADMRIFLGRHLSSENDLAPVPLTQLEVKEACTKALEGEQLAKERLSQMNGELNYHCRVTPLYRPRVTFASQTEEKDSPTINSSSSKPEKEDIKARAKRNKKMHE